MLLNVLKKTPSSVILILQTSSKLWCSAGIKFFKEVNSRFPVLLGERYPDVEIRTRMATFEALSEAVLAGQIDLALTYDLGLHASFQREVYVQVAPQAWFPPDDPLAGRATIRLADLVNRKLILCDQGLSIRHMLGLFRSLGVTPLVAHRAASIEVLRSLAANGEGVGICYTNPAGGLSYDGKPLERASIIDRKVQEPIVLVHRGDQPAPLPEIRATILKHVARKWEPVSGQRHATKQGLKAS
jgi:DNA-binding transcriptional LysR family regulator